MTCPPPTTPAAPPLPSGWSWIDGATPRGTQNSQGQRNYPGGIAEYYYGPYGNTPIAGRAPAGFGSTNPLAPLAQSGSFSKKTLGGG